MQLPGQSFMFFVQVKGAGIHSKVLGTCGACDSFLNPTFDFVKEVSTFINQKNKRIAKLPCCMQCLL